MIELMLISLKFSIKIKTNLTNDLYNSKFILCII